MLRQQRYTNNTYYYYTLLQQSISIIQTHSNTRKCKIYNRHNHHYYSTSISTPHSSGITTTNNTTTLFLQPNPQLINTTFAPLSFDPHSVSIYYNNSNHINNNNHVQEQEELISIPESQALLQDVMTKFKRKRIQRGHWDDVITHYKEMELFQFPNHLHHHHHHDDNSNNNNDDDDETSISPLSKNVITRIQTFIQNTPHFQQYNDHNVQNHKLEASTTTTSNNWLPAHAIYLHSQGTLKPHVDSIKFSGNIVAGLSLLSPSIMRLKPVTDPATTTTTTAIQQEQEGGRYYIDMYLPPLSLYILSGMARYEYTHELLPSGSIFQFPSQSSSSSSIPSSCTNNNSSSICVDRNDRISIIFRNVKTTNK